MTWIRIRILAQTVNAVRPMSFVNLQPAFDNWRQTIPKRQIVALVLDLILLLIEDDTARLLFSQHVIGTIRVIRFWETGRRACNGLPIGNGLCDCDLIIGNLTNCTAIGRASLSDCQRHTEAQIGRGDANYNDYTSDATPTQRPNQANQTKQVVQRNCCSRLKFPNYCS